MENAMRLQAWRAMGRLETSRIGQITSYDPNRHAVKVTYQPDSIASGWLPLAAAWVGNGCGIFAAPRVGQTVTVSFLGGSLDAGIAELRLFNTANQPLAVPAGELWIVHLTGAFWKLLNAGGMEFSDANGATITLDGAGNINSGASQWNHSGNVKVTGNMDVTGTVTGETEVVAKTGGGAVHLSTHTNTGVQTGGGVSGTPTPGS